MSEQYAAPPPGPQFTISDDRIYGEALLGGYSLIARVYGDPELAAIFAAAPATAAERDRLVVMNTMLAEVLENTADALEGMLAHGAGPYRQKRKVLAEARAVLSEARKP